MTTTGAELGTTKEIKNFNDTVGMAAESEKSEGIGSPGRQQFLATAIYEKEQLANLNVTQPVGGDFSKFAEARSRSVSARSNSISAARKHNSQCKPNLNQAIKGSNKGGGGTGTGINKQSKQTPLATTTNLNNNDEQNANQS